MTRKIKIYLLLFLFIVFPSIIFPLFFHVTGSVSLSMHGFAVDSRGQVYVGLDEWICVFSDGIQQKKINPQTSRGYTFTIQADTLIVASGDAVVEMDLQGTVLREYDDAQGTVYDRLRAGKTFISEQGDEYQLRNSFLRFKIVKNGDLTVYQMPLKDFLAKISLIFGFVSLFVLIPFVIPDLRSGDGSPF